MSSFGVLPRMSGCSFSERCVMLKRGLGTSSGLGKARTSPRGPGVTKGAPYVPSECNSYTCLRRLFLCWGGGCIYVCSLKMDVRGGGLFRNVCMRRWECVQGSRGVCGLCFLGCPREPAPPTVSRKDGPAISWLGGHSWLNQGYILD